ncbi:cytochrome b [bacterium endosymbiont of Bathymodiolus sp. 5 South]|jgi:cytochrome b561|uniref:cytochrome b n=1 Tax=bacterium endosymbiont of Bathymodiolus sp. 5 South TaxID=1181670 RepID=UPI0010B0371A|nr:cytochrome b [bacterium endosymbiont of Bathymodiolus sp. 5 South]VVH62941.1 Cytochrome B561 [uncultured Gammaproteobacteria bacterium]SSC08094.1 Cytochrome B561 [bacterium endosymbiont of Bathymodiolus sp. 5 South]VVM17542.1 Cytochrome B561 [uncultured Gammaproteobacteria bacterium]VVM18685.1 Cytochrome B561 [uncultured Gammaproteobacteria bacterium]VVM23122.1 Cytochrome B561 [uncultured Gammaproteobacteria bacterium]
MRDTKDKLSNLTIFLHWVVGLTIIALAAVGVYMSENEAFELYPIHKSIGVLIFAVIIVRVYWRFVNGWLQPVTEYKAIEHNLAKIIHWVLIIAMIIMPISGFIMSGAGGYGVSVFGLEIIAAQFDLITKEAIPHNAQLAGFMHETHEIAGWTIIVAISLHIAGAIKHHFIDKDNTLRRMLGKN